MHDTSLPAIGILGGTGLYDLDGFQDAVAHRMETPFGAPSGDVVEGWFAGRRVCFLPRHGRGHVIAPAEINHRANIAALRMRGVRWVIAVTAVGSLREDVAPRHIVLPDQFFDRMSGRERHTFFGGGIVAHVPFGEPLSPGLRVLLRQSCERLGATVHPRGTYVAMDGPAFSTLAEAQFYRSCGFDVIGMTNLPEAKLAREAEMALATLAMVTDYDCWHPQETHVTAGSVAANLQANAATARQILADVIPHIPAEPDWPEHRSLDAAILTARESWPPETVGRLEFLLDRLLR